MILLISLENFNSNSDGLRLLQIRGSSVNDKLEQILAVIENFKMSHLIFGTGLGVSLPGIVRDDARPYSYEAQTPVLLWQGGIFFLCYIRINLMEPYKAI
jgi:hypothetical protein